MELLLISVRINFLSFFLLWPSIPYPESFGLLPHPYMVGQQILYLLVDQYAV